MLLIGIIPYAGVCGAVTGGFGFRLFQAFKSAGGEQPSLERIGWLLAGAAAPTILTWTWWNVYYHGLGTESGVDTNKYVSWKDAGLKRYYNNRRIPICELYELYVENKFDWNPACENGDCFQILSKHRDKFCNYKTTWRQVWWLVTQFLPWWMTGTGLGKGSSSGKSIEKTTKEIQEHYDKGNDVFSCILGKAMVYTCGVFHSIPKFASDGVSYAASAADGSLELAQGNKMSMICDKLMLKKGEKFLDIGCGWGTLARHAAKQYGAVATGVTLSNEGKKYCDLAATREAVSTKILCCDYRDIPKEMTFDKVTAIEMAEHVGCANFVNPFLVSIREMMSSQDSKFMLQVAGLRQGSNWEDVQWGLFMSKYIFPGADASTPLNWYIRQCELAGFEVHSVETIGRHYSHTLHKWYDNWMSHKNEILSGRVDAINDASKGVHLFRLQEFFLAWSTIASGQSSATCYQILCHPNSYEYPRDQWVDPKHVSGCNTVGVSLNNGKSPALSLNK